MGTTDPRVDAYIDKAQPFAKPILQYLRKAVHAGCPDVVETMKWSVPHFTYQGMLCSMASFKEHCTFGFWKASLLEVGGTRGAEARGQFGRITSVKDLPPQKVLVALVEEAAALNETGVKVERQPRERQPLPTPDYLLAALKKNKKALATFESFSPSHRREYVEWITEARREETRQRRLGTALEWLAEGRPRNWKYGKNAE